MSIAKSKVLASAAVAGLLLAGAAGPATWAQNPRTTHVDMSFCNKTSGTIYLALSYKDAPASTRWVVEGWKVITAGTCFRISVPNDGLIYDYAEDETDGDWGGDFKLCVDRPGPFKRINSADYTCDAGNLVGFGVTDAAGKASQTVNYNP